MLLLSVYEEAIQFFELLLKRSSIAVKFIISIYVFLISKVSFGLKTILY